MLEVGVDICQHDGWTQAFPIVASDWRIVGQILIADLGQPVDKHVRGLLESGHGRTSEKVVTADIRLSAARRLLPSNERVSMLVQRISVLVPGVHTEVSPHVDYPTVATDTAPVVVRQLLFLAVVVFGCKIDDSSMVSHGVQWSLMGYMVW